VRQKHLLLALSLLAGIVGSSRIARAENALVESYDAPVGCPDVTWFSEELQRRSSSASVLEGAVRVRVDVRGDHFSGRVQRVRFASDLGSREVEDESCEQVVEALALIAALLLTPNAVDSLTPLPRSPDQEPPAPPVHVRKRSEASRPTGPVPLPPQGSSTAQNLRLSQGISIGLAAQTSLAPYVGFGPRLGYRLLLQSPRWGSELGLSLTRIQSARIVATSVGAAETTYTAGRLSACQLFPLVERLWGAPCAMLDIGQLRGRGTVTGGQSHTRSALWLSPGLLGKLEWRVRSPLIFALTAGAFFPLSRPEFHFTVEGEDQSRRTIQRVPEKFGLSADLTLGALFP
jgi:hypothetical protein